MVTSPCDYLEYAFEQLFRPIVPIELKKRVELAIRKKVVLDMMNTELAAHPPPIKVEDLIDIVFSLFVKAGLITN